MKTKVPLLVAALISMGLERVSLAAMPSPAPGDSEGSLSNSTPSADLAAPSKTIDTSGLDRAIDAFIKDPTPTNDDSVEKAFAAIALEISKLEASTAKSTGAARDEAILSAKNLTDYRNAEALRFAKAKATAAAKAVRTGTPAAEVQSTGSKNDGELQGSTGSPKKTDKSGSPPLN